MSIEERIRALIGPPPQDGQVATGRGGRYTPEAAGSAFSITGLTEVDPALDDFAAIADTSDSGNNKKVAIGRVLAKGPHIVQGRLTLTTAVPVTTSDVTAAGTLYFTPIIGGNAVRVFDNTRWIYKTFSEISLSLSLTSGKNYDVFLDDDAATLSLSSAWTNDTTRADALALQDGVYVLNSDKTKLYVGTIRASGTNTTEDSVAKRFVWNMYNRVDRRLLRTDSTNSWTYSTASYQQANASGANLVEFVRGLDLEPIWIQVNGWAFHSSAGQFTPVGIGDGSATNVAELYMGASYVGAPLHCQANYAKHISAGYHAMWWLEAGAGLATVTWYGDNGGSLFTGGGIMGWVKG